MERIKEALDRVKAERGDDAPGAGGGKASPSAAAAPRMDHSAPVGNSTSVIDQIINADSDDEAAGLAGGGWQVSARDVVELDARHLEKHRIVAHQKHNVLSGTFDLLRTQVLHKMAKHGWNTVGVVSPAPGAGKTVTSINLALSIAQLRDRTSMLLDFDLRRPSVLRYLGMEPEVSLNEVLDGDAKFSDVLSSPLLPRFSVAAAAKPVPHSAEVLSSQRLVDLVSEVKGRYRDRTVICDLPPVLNADDALAIMPSLDCVLIVIGSGMSSRLEIEEMLRRLPSSNVIGTVFNKAKVSVEAYEYV